MSDIDQRVVEMKFNNSQFSKGIQTTLSMLGKLKTGLRLDGATKGLEDVSAAAGDFNSQPMAQGASRVAGSFTAMQAVALGALASIGSKAVAVAEQVLSAFSTDPISAGFEEYETNVNSIQTILANTQASGATLEDVNGALQNLNHYSDQTIYNFSEMARNIGTFTAAGVNLDTSANAIKGIANLAALPGSNSQQASTAMYQLSQAISAGKVSLEDWNSVQNAGMGGTIFQRALAETAVAMGEIDKGALKLTGDMKNVTINGESFRNSISAAGGGESWLTSEVLTNTLAQFTGDLSDAELAAQGFGKAQIEAIKAQAATAVNAATEVKTFSGLMDTLKEGVTSGWSQTFAIIFGDFEEAKTLFTGLSNSIGGFFGRTSEARNELLSGWEELGGRTALIEGLTEAFWVLGKPLAAVGQAFRQIFPPMTAQNLYDMTVAFREFVTELIPAPETMDKLRRTFAGVFAILGIGWEIIKAVARFFLDLFSGIEEGDKGILKITASIGDWLVKLHEAVKNGEGLTKFFDGLRTVLFKIINPIKDLGKWLGSIFEGAESTGASANLDKLRESLEPLGNVGEKIASVWGGLLDVFSSVKEAAGNVIDNLSEWFGGFGDMFGGAFEGINFDTLATALQTGLLGGIFLAIKKISAQFSLFGDDVGGGFVESIKDAFGDLTDTLTAMQQNLKANILLKIAAAIGIMTLSVVALSNIDSEGLTRALTAMTVMFTQLGAALFVFSTIGTPAQMVKLVLMGAALILLATAIRILASAVKKMAEMELGDLARGLLGVTLMIRMLASAVDLMSGKNRGMIRTAAGLVILAFGIRILVESVEELAKLDWNELAKGLVGVGVLLGALALFTRLADADKGGISQGLGIILLAVGLKVLASAVKDFAEMSWEDMSRGLVGVAGGLIAMAAALRLLPAGSVMSGAAILMVAASLKLVASAVEDMSGMSWEEIGKGVSVLAGALLAISAAIRMLPKGAMFSAAAILIVATSLQIIGTAIQNFGGMSWEEIAKGLVVLAGSLGIIAGAMMLMAGALPGAAALIVVAGALAILAPILMAFSEMSWEEILKGLAMLGGALLVLGVAGALIAPAVIPLMGLGIAIGLIGIGVLAAGVGLFVLASGLTLLAAAGAGATAVIVSMIKAVIDLIPEIAVAIGEGLVAFAKVIAVSGPAIISAITTVLSSFLDAIVRVAPKAGQTFLVVLQTILRVLVTAVPMLVNAGMQILIGFLDGIARHIGKVVDKATDVIVNFIDGISRNLPRIIQSGVDLIIAFMQGIGDAARNNGEKLADAAWDMATGIIEGMVDGLISLGGNILDALMDIIGGAWDAVLDFLGIASPSKKFKQVGQYVVQGLVIGLKGGREDVREAVDTMFSKLNESLDDTKQKATEARQKLKDLESTRKDLNRKYIEAHQDLDRARAKGHDTRAEERRVVNAYNVQLKNYEAIQKQKVVVAELNAEYTTLNKARYTFTNSLKDEQNRLWQLATQYDRVNARLDDAWEKLKAAKDMRNDYNLSIRNQYSAMKDVDKATKLTDYTRDLRKQIIDTQNFTIAIQELRKRGLNDEMYKQLLAKGPETMPFVQELLAGGKTALDDLNRLTWSLDREANKLGDKTSASLYQAGVNIATGLVKGLEREQKNIEKQMAKIADYMVRTMKNRLGIRSPSRIFAELGAYSAKGLSQGLEQSAWMVGKSAEGVGQTAIDSMKKTISGLGNLVSSDIDLNPVVTPVLDLASIKKDASQIGSMLTTKPITVEASYSGAVDASAGYSRNEAALAEAVAATTPTETITFIQNNNSPKALSPAEIYRQTRNQLSVAKGALTSNAR